MMWSLKSTSSKVLRPLLLVYVQPIYHLQGLGWTEGAGTWWPGTPWCGPSRRRCTASRASPPPSCPPRSRPSARSPGLGPGPATLAKRGQPRSSCNMTSVRCEVLLSLHCGYLHMRGDLMETVVSVFINDIRSVERNFFVWIDAHQEGRDWCLQNLSDLKQYFRLLSQWLRVWLKPKHFFQINSFINKCWKQRCYYLKHFHTPMFVTKHTHGATVHCHCDIQYLHRSGLVWSASTSCPPRPPPSPAPSSSGRSLPARSRWQTEHWAHSNIPILKQKMCYCILDLFQMQNMCHFISDAKVWVWKVWILGQPWLRREWWRQLELGSHFLKLNLQGTMVFTCQHQFLLCLIFHCFIFPLARA